MARYIDADKFIKWIEKQKRLSKDYTIFMLQETAAAKVKEIKHGEWIECQKLYGIGYEYVCSVCEKGVRQYESQPICSECGAKMDGGKEE